MNALIKVKWPLLDIFIWATSGISTVILRYEKLPNGVLLVRSVFVALILGVIFRSLLYFDKRFFGTYVDVSFDEILSFSRIFIVLVTFGSAPLFFIGGDYLPRSFIFLTSVFSFTLMLGARFFVRIISRKRVLSGHTKSAIIYGGGFYAEMVLRQVLDNPRSDFRVDGIIDDNPKKLNSKIQGVRVLGTSKKLSQVVSRHHPDTIIIAVANVKPDRLRQIDEIAASNNISVSIVPSLSALLGKQFSMSDLKPLDESDLIGRKIIEVDLEFLMSKIRNKRIIVTGAGGSIGSELSRQLSSLQPAFLGLLDRDESGLLATQLSINNEGLLSTSNLILADIRDEKRLKEIFELYRPEMIFHAAALKHLPLLQANPNEAWKTNVVGTLHLLELSEKFKVETFVNISTDKAADPISVLGYSKLLTERMTSYFAKNSYSTNFISVRFGNVFGSRGSVIGTFNHQISAGGPVTVTDPEVTRYFMTIHEAVHLVLRASRIGQNGETLVLNMGNPVNILEIAQKLIARSRKKIEIQFSGIREGEKVHEDLFSKSEKIESTSDSMINKTRVEELTSLRLDDLSTIYLNQIQKK